MSEHPWVRLHTREAAKELSPAARAEFDKFVADTQATMDRLGKDADGLREHLKVYEAWADSCLTLRELLKDGKDSGAAWTLAADKADDARQAALELRSKTRTA